MTRVDFYVTSGTDRDGRLITACRLADKAYRLGHRIYIHADSREEAAHLDDLLWTFKAGSFVPHARQEDPEAGEHPVVIGHTDDWCENRDVMINLARAVPSFFSRFERVAEVVQRNGSDAQPARERFRFYRDRGYPLETHEIDG